MRHIRITAAPDASWLKDADAILAQLQQAPDPVSRNAIIDANDHLWGKLKTWLLSFSHQKCWYSETKDCFNHPEVEHYRPKKSAWDVDGTVHEGYWWLAFDWKNYRICGNVGNRKKGNYFPLRPGNGRISPGGDTRYEVPLLLDPLDPEDPNLLSFDLEGRAKPAADVHDDWQRTRVEYSIRRYRLDFGPLADQRKIVWSECARRIEDYKRELAIYQKDQSNQIAHQAAKAAMAQLRELIREEKELSAVARACVWSSGDDNVRKVLVT